MWAKAGEEGKGARDQSSTVCTYTVIFRSHACCAFRCDVYIQYGRGRSPIPAQESLGSAVTLHCNGDTVTLIQVGQTHE